MPYLPDIKCDTIVLHYSATPIDRDYTAADIDAMHRKRGFRKIGYHFYIRKDGTVEAGRDMSRRGMFEIGAHVSGHNRHSIGICCEGGVTLSNLDKGIDNRTEAQKRALVDLIHDMLDRYPGAAVIGHRDMPGAATQCPGYDASAWWREVSAKPKPTGGILASLMALFKAVFGGK